MIAKAIFKNFYLQSSESTLKIYQLRIIMHKIRCSAYGVKHSIVTK